MSKAFGDVQGHGTYFAALAQRVAPALGEVGEHVEGGVAGAKTELFGVEEGVNVMLEAGSDDRLEYFADNGEKGDGAVVGRV